MKKRWGIRAKLLTFYAVTMLSCALLVVIVQITAYGAAEEYEGRLSRYHTIHRFKVALDTHYTSTERRLREDLLIDETTFETEMSNLWNRFNEINAGTAENLRVYFNTRAVERGLVPYGMFTRTAVDRRNRRESAWYQSVADANRIYNYMNGYLSILLSESMNSGEARYRIMVRNAGLVRNISVAAISVIALFLLIFAAAYSGSVTAPIRKLAGASKRMAAGDLAVDEVTAVTGDEVEILVNSFNEMSVSIRTMVENLRDKAEIEKKLREEERELMQKEQSLREAQFQTLQDQIRPHFLFNALNTIARTALFENASETERLTLALGKLLHYSLGPAPSMVPVREEAAILKEYLAFQSLRFGDRLSWDIILDERARDMLIPRFTLQPLVENAVRHGIEPLEHGGRVEIRIACRGGRLVLSVEDTGVGIDARKRSELLSRTGSTGIGISNILTRLALRYMGDEKVSITGSRNGGTIVKLSFPAEKVETQ